MYPATLPLSDGLKSAHAQTWELIAQPGDFFTGDQRQKMVRAAREALTCYYCEERKAALSPNAVTGEHDDSTGLDDVIVDVVHRIRTDPGRLTRLVGPSRAKMILMAGQKIDTDTASQWGLVDQIAPPETLLETARTLASDTLAAAPDHAAAIKRLCDS